MCEQCSKTLGIIIKEELRKEITMPENERCSYAVEVDLRQAI